MTFGSVLTYFQEIAAIPRPSKHEEQIRDYLRTFAETHGFSFVEDAAGNICIRKPAYPGREDAPGVVLQGHMDMVCEKDPGRAIDFTTDPIEVVAEDGWLTARGTTLGADNGIGMALALDVLTSDVRCGPLECLFTVDEETGMTGANSLEPGMVAGRLLINLDSEEEGSICTGCAGGIDTSAEIFYTRCPSPMDDIYYRLEVDGLVGGHSGTDIHLGRANAVKILTAFLRTVPRMVLCEMSGGNLRNAIPRHAFAVFGVPVSDTASVEAAFARFSAAAAEQYQTAEPNFSLSLLPESPNECAIPKETADALLAGLDACPHGVLAMSDAIPDLVQTSNNLASVQTDAARILVTTLARSMVDREKYEVAERVRQAFLPAGAVVVSSGDYPGWTPDQNSRLLKTAVSVYTGMFGTEPAITATHGGLECGLIGSKYPGMAMISIGPTIVGAHSPKERLEIASVARVRAYLAELLERIGADA